MQWCPHQLAARRFLAALCRAERWPAGNLEPAPALQAVRGLAAAAAAATGQHAAGTAAALQPSSSPATPAGPDSSNGSAAATTLVSPALLSRVSATVNQLTGYEAIDQLKGRVEEVHRQLQDGKAQLADAKAAYDGLLATQTRLHREVTALLQRKASWVPSDVARFTELYAQEHETETAVAAAKAGFTRLSEEVEGRQAALVDLIRERYQQEQLWSDKIRRASTWWTWGLMGLHFASFVAVYSVLEPAKRAALQQAMADMLAVQSARLEARLAALQGVGGSGGAAGVGAAAGVDEGGGSSGGGEAQQQQQWPAAAESQLMMAELRQVQQQLQALHQALPAAAAVAAADAAAHQVQQEQRRRWQLPGGAWAGSQLAAVGQGMRAACGGAVQRVQQAAATVRQLPPEGADAKLPQQEEQQQLQAAEQQQSTPGPAQRRSSHPLQELLRQWREGGRVIEVTRGQLAGLAAAAGAAGAGVALLAVLAAATRGGGGGGGASAGA